jgi:hypothetical protein
LHIFVLSEKSNLEITLKKEEEKNWREKNLSLQKMWGNNNV